jgi:hypothetical protein
MRASSWFLVITVALIGYVLLKGGEERFAGSARKLDYDVVAVSQGLTPQAQALNLERQLEVSLLPEIGKQAIREAAGRGLKEQAFLESVLRDVSDRVREISTIDLNGDETADPILVKPEPGGEEGYVVLSLRVPAPEAYPLPPASDQAAWKDVETFEVATMTVSLSEQELAVEAQGNRHLYPDSAGQHYIAYDRSPSFLQTYFAIRMLDWMFFPHSYGFWGPGWGYGAYRPLGVPAVLNRRASTISSRGYQGAPSTAGPVVRSRSGAAPRSAYSRAFSSQPPRSLEQLRSSRSFARRAPSARVGTGGFGRGGTAGRSAAPGRYSSTRAAPRGFGGFGRGSLGSSFRGGGLRFGK